MSKKEFYDEVIASIVDLDDKKSIELANKAISMNMSILELINEGFSKGIQKVGEIWEEGELFLPELIMAANIVQDAMTLLLPYLKEGEKNTQLGTVLIATIEGDVHSIGKNIVATMLNAYGFKVIDLGAEVPAETIVDEALKNKADVIAVSALLTTTMPGQKRVISLLNEKGIRDQFKVIFGGAPVTKDWSLSNGADGYASNASDAVNVIKEMLHINV